MELLEKYLKKRFTEKIYIQLYTSTQTLHSTVVRQKLRSQNRNFKGHNM